MITRQEYMADSENLHQAYYLETAQMAGLSVVNLPTSIANIRKALETDKNLNNISLQAWDYCVTSSVRAAIARVNVEKEGQHASSLSDGVCALKALARHLAGV